jgi:tetratricopeptide (TPR) repeat protein
MATHRRFRLNRKLIVVTLALTCTGGVGVHFAHRAQVASMIERSRGIGLTAAENSNWREAVAHLKLYLQHHPEDTAALTACANALVEGYNELENASKLYEQALQIDHYNHDVRRRYVDLALKLGKTDAAVANSRILADRFPSDGEVMFLAGKAAEADSNFIDAIRSYRQTCRFSDTHVGANQRLAVLYKVLANNDLASAKAIERLEKSGDQSFETLKTLAEHHLSQGRFEEAGEQLFKAINRWEAHTEQVVPATQIATRIAQYESGRRNIQVARDLLDRFQEPILSAMKAHPESVFFDMSLAQLQACAEFNDESVKTLERAMQRVPDNRDLHFQLTWQQIDSRQFEAADENIRKIRSSTDGNAEINQKHADLLDAVATLQKGDLEAAATQLHSVILNGIQPSAVAPIVRRMEAECYEQLADWTKAAETWGNLLKLEPNNHLARLSMAFSIAASGRYGEAVRELNSIPRLGYVIAKVDRLSTEQTDCQKGNRLRSKFNLSNRLLNDQLQIHPRVRQLFSALLHVAREEYQEAHQALESRDDIQERLLDIVALANSSQVVDAQILKTIVRIDRGDARPVTTYLLSGRAETEELQLLAEERLAGLAQDEWVKAAGILASGVAGAARSLRQSAPEKAEKLHSYAGVILDRMVKFNRAVVPQIVEYHISANRPGKAIEWCHSSWPERSGKLAPLWLAAALQHPSAAEKLAELERALMGELNRRDSKTGNEPKTEASFNSERANEIALRETLADLYMMTGRDSLAEPAYLAVLALKPDHVASLNNVAWLKFLNQRQLSVAESLIAQALEVVGNRPDLVDTRGCIRLVSGDAHAAAKDFRNAIQLGAGADSIFHLALALQRTGDGEEARKTLIAAEKAGFDITRVSSLERRLSLEIAD